MLTPTSRRRLLFPANITHRAGLERSPSPRSRPARCRSPHAGSLPQSEPHQRIDAFRSELEPSPSVTVKRFANVVVEPWSTVTSYTPDGRPAVRQAPRCSLACFHRGRLVVSVLDVSLRARGGSPALRHRTDKPPDPRTTTGTSRLATARRRRDRVDAWTALRATVMSIAALSAPSLLVATMSNAVRIQCRFRRESWLRGRRGEQTGERIELQEVW